ncbi:MAG: LolA family protein [Flavobacteriales bacterium]
MKKILILTFLILNIQFIQAQDAKTLLNEVSNKVRSYDNIFLSFNYSLNNPKENVTQKTKGDLTLQNEKYVLNWLGITRIFNGSKIYTIIPEDEEITISTFNSNDEKSITPSKMLTFYEKGYNFKMDILQNIKGRKIQYIKLIPIDNNAEIKDILLGIDQQTKHIYKLIQTDAQGTQYTVTVNSFKTNQPISENRFKCNTTKYEKEGYYINQLD